MAPRVCAADWFYVDPDEPAEPGRLAGLRDPETGEETCCLLIEEETDGRRMFRALDADWPAYVLDRESETMMAGTVVFAGRGV